MLRTILILICIQAWAMPAPVFAFDLFSSEVKVRTVAECPDLKLQSASGVPQEAKHGYVIAGPCAYVRRKWVDGEFQGQTVTARAFLTLGGVWNERDNTFKEAGKLEGDAKGEVNSIFKCASDPYLNNVPCTPMSLSNSTPWPSLNNKPRAGRPIGQGFVDAAEAAQLSKESKSDGPPPPPPPPAPEVKLPRGGGTARELNSPILRRPPPVLKAPSTAKEAPRLPPVPPAKKSPAHKATPTLSGNLKGGMQYGINLFGGDYKGFRLAQPNPELCRQACNKESRCRSWTYTKPGIKGPQAACFLKDKIPPPRKQDCCVSGVK